MLGPAVVIAVPDAVELLLGLGPSALDLSDQVIAHRLAVVPLPGLVDAQGVEDEWLLLVDDLSQVAQGAAVERGGVHMDMDAAPLVDFVPAAAHRPDHFLEGWDVGVGDYRAHHLGPQVAGNIDERAVGDDLPGPALFIGDLPGGETGLAPDVADLATHHRLNGAGHTLAIPFDRLDLDSEVDLA